MANSPIIEQIYQHPALNGSEVETICQAHEKLTFKKRELLLREGQSANEYFCLESGLNRVFAISSDGKLFFQNFREY